MFVPSPVGLMLAGIQTSQMLVEAHCVATLRLLGLAGLWPLERSEAMRMVTEKPGAFAQSSGAAALALMQGKRPDQVMEAAIRPLRRKTRSNSRRLSKSKRKPAVKR